MRIYVTENYEAMSKKAASLIAAQVRHKPTSVLGLATGDTPLLMYKELVRMHQEEGLSFSHIKTFNLDEYVGLSPQNTNSYHYYMFSNFFQYVDIERSNIQLPDGLAKDIEKECALYEAKILACGGIDLQILGLGQNGHIGFNEPGTSFEKATHMVRLSDDTINNNSRYFGYSSKVPRYAISLGIKTIMMAKEILLIASGSSKAKAVNKLVNGEITPKTPASILQLHQNASLVLDKNAAASLDERVLRDSLNA